MKKNSTTTTTTTPNAFGIEMNADTKKFIKLDRLTVEDSKQLTPVIKGLTVVYHNLNNAYTGGKLPTLTFFPNWTATTFGGLKATLDADRYLVSIGIRHLAGLSRVDLYKEAVLFVKAVAAELSIPCKDSLPDKTIANLVAGLDKHYDRIATTSAELVNIRDKENAARKELQEVAKQVNKEKKEKDRENRQTETRNKFLETALKAIEELLEPFHDTDQMTATDCRALMKELANKMAETVR